MQRGHEIYLIPRAKKSLKPLRSTLGIQRISKESNSVILLFLSQSLPISTWNNINLPFYFNLLMFSSLINSAEYELLSGSTLNELNSFLPQDFCPCSPVLWEDLQRLCKDDCFLTQTHYKVPFSERSQKDLRKILKRSNKEQSRSNKDRVDLIEQILIKILRSFLNI